MRKTGTNKICEQCGTSFYVPAWRSRQNAPVRFCSMECSWTGRKRRSKKPLAEATCEECGKSYLVFEHRIGKTRFCSMECSGAHQFRKMHAAKRPRAASSDQMKVCICCGQERPRTEFYKRPENPDGLRADCKSCVQAAIKVRLNRDDNREKKNAGDRAYYAAHKEEAATYNAERYAADKEGSAARNKKWRDEHPEEITAYNRRKREEKGEEVRARRRADYRKNKGRYVAQARAREELIKRATPPWADLKAIEQFYIQAERLTRETGIKHHVDHFYPLQGKTMCGLHVEANLRVVPAAINLRKSNRIEEEVGAPLCCAWPAMVTSLQI